MTTHEIAAPSLPVSGVAVPPDSATRLSAVLRRVGLALIRMRLRSVLHGFTDYDLRRLGQSRDEVERWLEGVPPR